MYNQIMLNSSRGLVVALALMGACLAAAQNPAEMKTEKAKLAKLEKSYVAAKAAYVKTPKDAVKKRAYITATVTFGTAVMNSGALAPRQKYPRALNLYREALKLDPKNKEALENKKMIEDIYRQMGRPIPK